MIDIMHKDLPHKSSLRLQKTENNKAKKILFCELYDDGTVGGSHSVLYNIVTNLDKNKIYPILAFPKKNLYFDLYKNLGITVSLLPHFPPSTFPLVFLRKAYNWFKLNMVKEKYLRKMFVELGIDMVVINNTIYTAAPFIKASKKLGIPIVIHERGINTYSKKEIALSKYISVSLPVSDTVKQALINQHVRSQSIIRHYDGVDEDKIRPSKSKTIVKIELGIPGQSRLIGLIGNVKSWKGQEYFVKAMVNLCKKYDNVYGIMVGAWKDEDLEFKKILDRIIGGANLQKRIFFTGYRSDVPDLLSALDIFVHASTKPEPFGMVVIEAMAAKVPVIATNFGGPIESLDKGKCGILVPPKNHLAIAEACEQYLVNRMFREQMINLAYKRYKKNFILKDSVNRLSNIYLNCIKL